MGDETVWKVEAIDELEGWQQLAILTITSDHARVTTRVAQGREIRIVDCPYSIAEAMMFKPVKRCCE